MDSEGRIDNIIDNGNREQVLERYLGLIRLVMVESFVACLDISMINYRLKAVCHAKYTPVKIGSFIQKHQGSL